MSEVILSLAIHPELFTFLVSERILRRDATRNDDCGSVQVLTVTANRYPNKVRKRLGNIFRRNSSLSLWEKEIYHRVNIVGSSTVANRAAIKTGLEDFLVLVDCADYGHIPLLQVVS